MLRLIAWRRSALWISAGVGGLALGLAAVLASGSCASSQEPTGIVNDVDAGDAIDSGTGGGGGGEPLDGGQSACPSNVCAPHYFDCNKMLPDGCEANLNADIANCGACGNLCGDAGSDGGGLPLQAVSFCQDGGCDWYCAPDPNFGPIYKRCGDDCIFFVCDPNNCGDCDVVCPVNELGNQVCNAGTCGCPFGTVDCDGVPQCGLECKDLNHDPQNCGECGRPCPKDPALGPFNMTYTCDGPNPDGGLPDCIKVCVQQIGNLWLDCNGDMQQAPDGGNGCETFGWGNTDHCGACGKGCAPGEVCHPINATSIAQECGCPNGLTYCPAAPYCRNLDSDPYNCGACGNVCPAPAHAKPTCVDGQCGFQCEFGFADCNHQADDGCEIDTLNNPDNCGGCTNDCDDGPGCGKHCSKNSKGEFFQRCANGVCATEGCDIK